MQNFGDFISAAGLVLVLALGVVVLRTIISMVFGKRRNQALLALQFMLLFGLAYGFHGSLIAYTGLSAYAGDIGNALASLLWFSIAFFATGALNRYVWHGRRAEWRSRWLYGFVACRRWR